MKTTTTTDKALLKRRILEAAKQKQEQVINDFRQRIKDAISTDGNVNEEEYDNHKQSFQAGILAEVDLLNHELEFVNQELEELKRIENFSDTIHQEVEPGSLVVTDKKTFLVSVSIEMFEVDGKAIYGISTGSPLYKAMKGKKAGEAFFFQTAYLIKEIF